MELGPFDPVDFKKFTDGKVIVKVSLVWWRLINITISTIIRALLFQDTDMDPMVENEAKLHISNSIEKASGATGVDIMVSFDRKWNRSYRILTILFSLLSSLPAKL